MEQALILFSRKRDLLGMLNRGLEKLRRKGVSEEIITKIYTEGLDVINTIDGDTTWNQYAGMYSKIITSLNFLKISCANI